MKPSRIIFMAALLIAVTGCNTLDKRISTRQAQFDAWPAEVREKIRAGRVDIGFTPEQVLVAMGEPVRKYQRTTTEGKSEVWAYTGSNVGFSIGLGMGSYRGGGAYAGGVAYETPTYGAEDERVRIVFENGVVTSVEKRAK
jgi:hypothetical protein